MPLHDALIKELASVVQTKELYIRIIDGSPLNKLRSYGGETITL